MRWIPPKNSKSLEIEYFKSLKSIVTKIEESFNNIVMTIVSSKPIQEQITDADYTLISINKAFAKFERQTKQRFNKNYINQISTRVTQKNVKRNKTIWINRFNPFGIDISKRLTIPNEQFYIKSRIQTNTRLITKMTDDYIDNLNTILYSSFQQGTSLKQLTKELKEQFGITQRKAKLIARNETKNTNTQLNNKQAKHLGFELGTWLGSEDEREREQHNKHNNKKYKIGVGLDDGEGGKEEPGDKINCRCTFYIDIPDDFQ